MAIRPIRVALVVVAAALVTLAAAPVPQTTGAGDEAQLRITQVDTSRFPRVTVYISATDAAGEPVGVDPQRLVLSENGRAMTIEEVRSLGESDPLSTLLVIDVSGSMNLIGKLQAAQAAARAYLAQMRAGDQAGVLTFNTQARLIQPLTADREALQAAIDSLQAADDTALYDGVAAAIQALEAAAGRRAILVLSDGMDNSSRVTPEAALAQIGAAGLSISTIGLGDPGRAPGEWAGLDAGVLRQLAEGAGGIYSAVADAQALRNLYLRLGRELQSEFVVIYTSPSVLRDGVNRSLSVSLASGVGPRPVQAEYNPGGLVPEVPQPAPWPAFLGALAVLSAMVAVPAAVPGLRRRIRQREDPALVSAARGRVRLQEPKEPRVRLR